MQVGGESGAAGPGRHEEIANGRESLGKLLERRPGSKSLHLPLALWKRDMRVLRSIVQPLVGAMFDLRHDCLASGGVGAEFVGDDALGSAALLGQEPHKQTFGCLGIPMDLDDLIKDITVLIDSAPQIAPLAPDRDNHFVQVPDIVPARSFAFQASLGCGM